MGVAIHTVRGVVCMLVMTRAYRPAEGGERTCNSHTSCIEGEMLAVTQSDTL